MQWALPPREARIVERIAFGCMAIMMAFFAYGIVRPLPIMLWRAQPLPDLPIPVAASIVVAGAPLVLEAALLLTGSLPRGRRWRVASALALITLAIILAPLSFFQSLPDPLVTPFVFSLITELVLLGALGAVCLVSPRGAWWALGLALAHAVVTLRIDAMPFSGPPLPAGWILARDGTLVAALLVLAFVLARNAAVTRPHHHS